MNVIYERLGLHRKIIPTIFWIMECDFTIVPPIDSPMLPPSPGLPAPISKLRKIV
jgi:hypothetical protein